MLTRTILVLAKALGLITYMLVELLFSDSGASMHLAKISSQLPILKVVYLTSCLRITL